MITLLTGPRGREPLGKLGFSNQEGAFHIHTLHLSREGGLRRRLISGNYCLCGGRGSAGRWGRYLATTQPDYRADKKGGGCPRATVRALVPVRAIPMSRLRSVTYPVEHSAKDEVVHREDDVPINYS